QFSRTRERGLARSFRRPAENPSLRTQNDAGRFLRHEESVGEMPTNATGTVAIPIRNGMTRSITFRLNLWYALTFLPSVAVLFVALYYLVSAAVQRQDRELVEVRLKELSVIYNSGGAPALRNWTQRSEDAKREKLFIRV